MNIITTKRLRDDMAQVVRDLQSGKSVQLSYRHKVIGTLQPINKPAEALRRGSSNAVQQFLENTTFGSVPKTLQTSSYDFKQEVSELRDKELDLK